jgi:hypothetical protein
VDVSAIQPDHDRQIRAGEFLTVTLAGVDEAGPFLAEFALQPLGHGLGLAADHGRVQAPAQRQQFTEQRGGDAVGDQAASSVTSASSTLLVPPTRTACTPMIARRPATGRRNTTCTLRSACPGTRAAAAPAASAVI